MSHNAKITRAGNKIKAFVKLRGGAHGKVDNGVSKSNEALQGADDGSTDYEAAADATVATFEAVAGSIDKFESGDPTQIAIGVLDILAEVSQFAALAGPKGAIVAAVVGPLCTIIGSLLGAQEEPPESQEEMFKRVIDEALREQTDNDLRSSALGVQKDMMEKMKTVQHHYDYADQLGQGDRDIIRDNDFISVGSQFLGKLKFFIERDTNTDDFKRAKTTAVLISTYATIAYLRCQHLFMLASLYGSDPDTRVTAKSTEAIAKLQRDGSRELLDFLQNMPDDKTHKTYAQVRLQPQSTLNTIQALSGRRLLGTMMTIFNNKQLQYLTVDRTDDDRGEVRTTNSGNSSGLSISNKFIVFRLGANGAGSDVEIFSIAHAGYVFASGINPVDNDRRRVNAWKKGNRVSQGTWTVTRQNDYGHAFVKNQTYKEYLYAADFKGSNNRKNVYTWRPQTPVSQGYWLFRESYTPPPHSTKFIRSVSSGNCMDGRSPTHVGITVFLTPKYESSYLHWELIKLADGTFNLRSISSDMFLDGRHEGIGNGYHMKLQHISHKDASTSIYFKWRLKEYTYDGRKRHAIQSVSSKLYLDGRGPSNTGGQLHFTGRDPKNDGYLMWDLMNV